MWAPVAGLSVSTLWQRPLVLMVQGGPKIDDLICMCVACNKLSATGCRLHCGLLLGAPVNRSLVEEIQDLGDRPSHEHVMVQIAWSKQWVRVASFPRGSGALSGASHHLSDALMHSL